MKEARFVSQNKEKWREMENISHLDTDTLASNYVILSDDLSYAKTFYPGSDVVKYLNQLISVYQINIYGQEQKKGVLSFWVREFPLLLYRERRMLLFAFVFLLFSALIGVFSTAKDDTFVRLILGDEYVDNTLENIENGTPMGIYSSLDEMNMFFMITSNNIKVAFVAFVFGIFFSAGTLWILFSNGVMLGAFQYFFSQHGLLLHSVMSVWAHGTFEITSIIIAGGAGLVMGNSFLFPGTYKRSYSFRNGALRGIKIVTGLIPFFIIAGWIESFITRYADAYPVVGAVAIVLSLGGVIGYFVVYPYYLHKTETNGKD
ncbi:MAG TPA: stage II sporulation protein M [Candidatus Butyricimonas faecavium]|nr:stage II sporulation protein M [Candidatus Butyricimonas faecavium]